MTPTLYPGQDVLSVNWFVNPKVGDIVVINSKQAFGSEAQARRGTVNREIIKRIQKIDGDQVWLEGDNKQESIDSRDFGPINMDQIVGKVIYQGIYGRKGRTLKPIKSISSY